MSVAQRNLGPVFPMLGAGVVFVFLLAVAPRTSHPDWVRALAVLWPIMLAVVSAFRIRRR